MISVGHSYAMALYTEDGRPIGEFAPEFDFEPAWQWASFQSLRARQIEEDEPAPDGRIVPMWHAKAGEPYLSGFRVCLLTARGKEAAYAFPLAYFERMARQASAGCVQDGLLDAGASFKYLVTAFPSAGSRRPGESGFRMRAVVPPVRVRADASMQPLLASSVVQGQLVAGDPHVFVRQQVLDEAVDLTRSTGADETGGILIGRLFRDRQTDDVFMEVTAQVAARHTQSAPTKLRFTGDTWTAVDAALALRPYEETMVGWWHCHSFMHDTCKSCAEETRRRCAVTATFLSDEDHMLHRTVFPRAFCVALVIGDSPSTGMNWGLYGWRRGVIRRRGFQLSSGTATAAADSTVPQPVGGASDVVQHDPVVG